MSALQTEGVSPSAKAIQIRAKFLLFTKFGAHGLI